MALTEEELKMQLNVLTNRTDQNPDMVFKTTALLNKGLNPELFSGNSTKIVNALNDLAGSSSKVTDSVQDLANKMNEILMDTSLESKAHIWENLKSIMGKDTIIEGLNEVLQGNKKEEILGITPGFIGNLVSVEQNADGKLNLVPVDKEEIKNDFFDEMTADKVKYNNDLRPEFPNVHSAITYLLDNQGSVGGGEGGTVSGNVRWENILNKPAVGTELKIQNDQLCLLLDNNEYSAIDLASDSDIDAIIDRLK